MDAPWKASTHGLDSVFKLVCLTLWAISAFTTEDAEELHIMHIQGTTLTGPGAWDLTLMVLKGGVLKLIRCLELGEVAGDLYPTFAYVEDQLGAKAQLLLLCGFGAETEERQRQFQKELGIPVEALKSPVGIPGETNAGLIGYLQGSMGRN